MQSKMELGIIPLYSMKQIVYLYFGIQFLSDLANKSLFGSLARLNLSTRKLPPIFEITITALGSEYLISFADNRRDYLNLFI